MDAYKAIGFLYCPCIFIDFIDYFFHNKFRKDLQTSCFSCSVYDWVNKHANVRRLRECWARMWVSVCEMSLTFEVLHSDNL